MTRWRKIVKGGLYTDNGGNAGHLDLVMRISSSNALFGNLPEYTEQVAAQEFADPLLGVAAAQHRVGNHRQIAYVAHAARQRRTAIEIATQGDVVLAHQLYGAIHHADPFVHGQSNVPRNIGGRHRKHRTDDFVELVDRSLSTALQDGAGVPERLTGMRHTPFERLAVVELVAQLEADHAAFGRQFPEQRVRHVARNVVDGAQPVMGGNHRNGARIDGRGDCLVGGVRNVDHHAEAVHFPNHFTPAIVQPVPLRRRTARVRIVARPVVRRKLHRTHAQAVHLPDHGRVAIQVEAAFDVQDGGNLAAPVYAFDVPSGARYLDALAVTPDLFDGGIQHAQRLFGFQTPGIVVLGHENGKEKRAESALFGARQIELAVGFPLADVAAVIELAIHGVNVAVEDQGARVQRARAFGNGRAVRGLRTQPGRGGRQNHHAARRWHIIIAP